MLRVVVLLLVVCAPAFASADDAATTREAMRDYFAGEQRGGYILIGMGAAGLVAGGLLYRQGGTKRSAWPVYRASSPR